MCSMNHKKRHLKLSPHSILIYTFTCVTRLVHVLRHDSQDKNKGLRISPESILIQSFTRVTRLVHMCSMTHNKKDLKILPDSTFIQTFTCVTRLVHTCGITRKKKDKRPQDLVRHHIHAHARHNTHTATHCNTLDLKISSDIIFIHMPVINRAIPPPNRGFRNHDSSYA